MPWKTTDCMFNSATIISVAFVSELVTRKEVVYWWQAAHFNHPQLLFNIEFYLYASSVFWILTWQRVVLEAQHVGGGTVVGFIMSRSFNHAGVFTLNCTFFFARTLKCRETSSLLPASPTSKQFLLCINHSFLEFLKSFYHTQPAFFMLSWVVYSCLFASP
jgi:hypothetical protein